MLRGAGRNPGPQTHWPARPVLENRAPSRTVLQRLVAQNRQAIRAEDRQAKNRNAVRAKRRLWQLARPTRFARAASPARLTNLQKHTEWATTGARRDQGIPHRKTEASF